MTHQLCFITLCTIWLCADARFFLARMPNGGNVPCVNDEPGCHGQTICESFGHFDCFPGKPINAFGYLYKLDPSGLWTVDKCVTDSDGDGYTNGDELGDPCCIWQYGQPPAYLEGISSPSHATSIPIRTSCSNTSLSAVSKVEITSATSNSTWIDITASLQTSENACVCGFRATIKAANNDTVQSLSSNDGNFTFCGLLPSTEYHISVFTVNRYAHSVSTNISVITTSGNNNPTNDGIYRCSGNGALYDTAGLVRIDQIPLRCGYLSAALLYLCVLLVGVVLLWGNKRDPYSTIRHALLHTSSAITPLRPFWRRLCWDITTASPAFIATFLVFVAGFIVLFGFGSAWFQLELFAWKQQLTAHRTAGYVLSAVLGAQLLPVTRYSIWMPLVGVSFERAIRVHRWLGLFTLILTLWHGLGMLFGFNATNLGWRYNLLWSPLDAINPLPGFIAGVFIVIMCCASVEPIRRRCYEAMLVAHGLWPFVILFACLHTWGSAGPTLYFVLPGVVLYGVDVLLLACDALLRPVEILDAGIVSDRPDDALWHRTAYLICQKKCRFAWLQRLWPFVYEPAQYINIIVPAVSLWPHPITISSPYE